MIAMMIATLFAASAVLAIGVIAESWHRHGGSFRALRKELAACATSREFRFTLVTTELRTAAACRPAIMPRAMRSLPLQPARRAA